MDWDDLGTSRRGRFSRWNRRGFRWIVVCVFIGHWLAESNQSAFVFDGVTRGHDSLMFRMVPKSFSFAFAFQRQSLYKRSVKSFQSKTTNGFYHVRQKLLFSATSSDEGVRDYPHLKQEALAVVKRASGKIRGSVNHAGHRSHHVDVYTRALREGLLRGTDGSLYRADPCAATKQLEADLGGIGANMGVMPDFSNPDALRGYALGHFGRSFLLSDLVTLNEPDWLFRRMSELFPEPSSNSRNSDAFRDNENITVASLGGGCGYDFVALAALSEYLGGPRIDATVYEYEPAWKEIVADIEILVRDMQECDHSSPSHRCGFESCDITSPLNSSKNEALASAINSTQIFSCSYVVAENAVKLRQSRFGFFRELFAEAPDGSLFFFTETTHRLWPDFIDLVRDHNKDAGDGGSCIRIAAPHIRCGKSGWQLALFKDPAALSDYEIPERERELYERFKSDNLAHLSRLDRGWKRKARKIRGAK